MTAAPVAPYATRPFPDGIAAWLDDAWWNVIPAQYRNAPIVWRARLALASALDDVWLREQTFDSHPIGLQARMRYGRWALLRLGVALCAFEVSDETRARLRTARHYVPCAAELDFGLFLATCGLNVEHEPLAPERGPDFRITANARAITFEVKCPDMSKALQATERVAGMLSMELQALVTGLKVSLGWFVEPMVSQRQLAKAAKDQSEAERLLTVLRTAILTWARSPKPLDLQLGTDMSLSIRRREAPGIQVWGPGFGGDVLHEVRRLVRLLQEAADQITAAKTSGFIVLAKERSGLLSNHLRDLTSVIRDDRTDLYRHVAGLISYSVEVSSSRSRLVARAHVLLKHEHRRLEPLVRRMQRGGEVSLQFF
ncbi:MAG TPA: hypothetical protein VHB79_23990 [Polyangiaceae bacterium]|nr:hypothetical protein [Polyangiaceae bacterium]